MQIFEIVVVLLLAGIALAALSRRFGAPYPALVALAGAAMALIPGLPTLTLDPELALTLFVAPVLLDAAFDSSPRDLRANWRPIASLALGAVALTIAVVAFVARTLVPDMPWAAAIALGAIVAPPDAAAATTVLKQLRPPRRILVILEGESLFNDASALLVYRIALGAVLTGAISGWKILPMLLVVTLGSIALGLVVARFTLALTARIRDVSSAIIVQFCGTFAIWILAERLHLSGIITMVVYAIAAARKVPEILPARVRIPAWAVWEVAVFVLNILAFILVGLQLKSIIEHASGSQGVQYFVVAAIVCIAVMVTRMVWVMGSAAFKIWRCRPCEKGIPRAINTLGISYGGAFVVSWCGMRGTVTLAAALALPPSFPHRDLILATAFGVTLGTLVLQGLTLSPLIKWLKLKDDGSVEREVRLARVESVKAAFTAITDCGSTDVSAHVRRSYELQLRRAERELLEADEDKIELLPETIPTDETLPVATTIPQDESGVIRRAIEAQRRHLTTLRAKNTIGDAAFQLVEQELDWMELGWAQVLRQNEEV